ncbi:MAG: uncharacterized protein A8A55_3163, partial [Amphiamblys sp. WSBS2006]
VFKEIYDIALWTEKRTPKNETDLNWLYCNVWRKEYELEKTISTFNDRRRDLISAIRNNEDCDKKKLRNEFNRKEHLVRMLLVAKEKRKGISWRSDGQEQAGNLAAIHEDTVSKLKEEYEKLREEYKAAEVVREIEGIITSACFAKKDELGEGQTVAELRRKNLGIIRKNYGRFGVLYNSYGNFNTGQDRFDFYEELAKKHSEVVSALFDICSIFPNLSESLEPFIKEHFSLSKENEDMEKAYDVYTVRKEETSKKRISYIEREQKLDFITDTTSYDDIPDVLAEEKEKEFFRVSKKIVDVCEKGLEVAIGSTLDASYKVMGVVWKGAKYALTPVAAASYYVLKMGVWDTLIPNIGKKIKKNAGRIGGLWNRMIGRNKKGPFGYNLGKEEDTKQGDADDERVGPQPPTGPQSAAATGPQPDAEPGAKPDAAPGAKPDAAPGAKPDAAPGPQPDAATGPQPAAATGHQPDAEPGHQ